MASNVAAGVIRTFDENELELIRNVIESGGMGTVGLYRLKGNRKVAVKQVVNVGLNEWDQQYLKEEANILWQIRKKCDYIVELLGILANETKFCLILEYMEHGSITSFFRVIPSKARLVPLKMQIANQVCEGMNFLHSRNPSILHCDLKAANVLLTADLNAKICDFGLAAIKKRVTEITYHKNESPDGITPGTISHLAPELLRVNSKQTKKSDVYSFGILLWELMTDETPYNGSSAEIIRQSVFEGKRPILDNISSEFKTTDHFEIMKSCWEENLEKRPEFKVILAKFSIHPISHDKIQECVERAKKEWIEHNKTHPKQITDTQSEQKISNSLNNTDGTGIDNMDFFVTDSRGQEFANVMDLCNRQEQPLNRVTECDEDSSSTEICISETESEHNTKMENTDVILSDPRSPILGDENQGNIVENLAGNYRLKFITKKMCVKLFCCAIFFLFGVGAGIGFGYFIASKNLSTFRSECNTDGMSSPNLSVSCCPMDYIGKHLSPGTKCIFSCKPGFGITTTYNNVTCAGTGLWSRPFPTCRKLKQCSKLLQPANEGSYQCTNDFYEQSMCGFACLPGYRLRLPNQNALQLEDLSFNVSCLSYGFNGFKWSGPVPYCEKVVLCKPLIEQDVTVSCTNSTLLSQNIPNVASQQNLVNGSTCLFSCPSGSSIFGDSRATCQADGNWNVTTNPTCRQGCPMLSTPVNGEYHCTRDRDYSSSCTFTCDKNFVLVGSGNLVCQVKAGVWKPQVPPYCVCPFCWGGTDCTHSLMWSVAVAQLNSSLGFDIPQTVIYAGRSISCAQHNQMKKSRRAAASHQSEAYGCQCIDKNTNLNKQCNSFKDMYSTCTSALSSLIFILVEQNFCELPCDATDMSERCK